MNNSACRALVLDFGGVISRTLFETHDRTEAALGLSPGTLTWRGPFARGGDALWNDMQAGEITERDYWLVRTRETGALVGRHWTRMDQFVKAARGSDPDAIIRPEFRIALATVQKSSCKLGILSNELDLFYGQDFRSKLPFLAVFDAIVDATHTNILKPDPRAYHSVCELLALTPHECVFVDDQLKNIHGAQAADMVTVHFDVTNPKKSYREALNHLGLVYPEETAACTPMTAIF